MSEKYLQTEYTIENKQLLGIVANYIKQNVP